MKVHSLPALDSNYFFALEEQGRAVVFDPGEEEVISRFLKEQRLELEAIWCTHHHWDHIDGVNGLLKKFNVPVFAPEYDLYRLPFKASGLKEGDHVKFHDHSFQILEFPGHTLGHIGYYSEKLKTLFSGDTLFSLGCGRLFEGTPEQMHKTLAKIKSLPPDTSIYFSHEYTLKNLEFLRSVKDQVDHKEPLSELERLIQNRLASEGKTVPTTLNFELKHNPFLYSDLRTFTRIRQLRNQF